MKKTLFQTTTGLIIWIVLMLPVAFAQQLTVQKFSGISNVNGFAKENDELTIQVLAEMLGSPTPEVARQRARVYYEDTYAFMNSCTPQAEAMYQCTYKTTDLVYGGTDIYTIKLFDESNKEIASVQKKLTVDILPPKIVQFSVVPNMSISAKPVKITYKAEDYGYETGKTTGCSGIKQVSITSNTTQVAQASAGIENCTKEGTYTFTPQIQGQSGRVTVCGVATDYVNHKSPPACVDILIDSRKPTPDALVLRDLQEYTITHARSNQQLIADVYVRIPDVDVNPASVYADLSKLNPSLGKKPKDIQKGEWFVWRNIAITTPSTCQVTVNASDMMGNKDSKTIICTIGIDDTPPEPLTLNTLFADEDGTPLLGINGTIYAEFTEAGSGMSKNNAFLDLRAIGIGTEVKADLCEKTADDIWKCEWNIKPKAPTGTYDIKLLPTTRDNLNNQVTKILQSKIRFDKTAPEGVRLVEIAAFREQQRVRTNYTSLGETLEFVVEGMGFTNAVADFTDLGGSKNTLPEHCEGNITNKTCTFAVTNAVSGPQNTTIRFDFFDNAGNKASLTTTELFILGISNETSPNYWTATTECSPELLDRTTLSVFEHPVFCRIKLASTNNNAMPLTVQGPLDYFSECTGQMEYISDMRIENNFAGSTEPYIVLSLVAEDYKINNLTLNCPISILTRVGGFVPQNFEHDNITIMLQFYNNPLGEAYDSIADEVDNVADKVEGVWKTISRLEKFFSLSEKICNIINMIINMVATLESILFYISTTASSASLGLKDVPGIGDLFFAEIKNTEAALCSETEMMRQFYDKGIFANLKWFCDFITCQKGTLEIFKINMPGVKDFTADWIGGFGLSEWLGMGAPKKYIAGTTEVMTDPNAYLNVKDSLVYSIFVPPLCIPGITYNLNKWRQIQCRYGLCLLEDVRQEGMPVSVCKDQKHYMECRFVMGEIFNIIPFAPIVNYFLNIVQRIISDPMLSALWIGKWLGLVPDCTLACTPAVSSPGIKYHFCAIASIMSQLGRSIDYIRSVGEMKDTMKEWRVSNEWCEDFEKAYDSFETGQQSTQRGVLV